MTMAGRKHLVLKALFFFIAGGSGALVTKCKSEDSKCAKESGQALLPMFAAGLPEHHVKTLDPVSFKRIDASSPNLKLVLTDVAVTGLKDSLLKKVKRDKTNNKLHIKLLCSCQLEGQYEMKGQLLILPIQGKGPLHVKMSKMEISLDIEMGETKIGGVTHWDIKGWKHSYVLKDKSDVVFENLFDGNEVLAQAAREVISNSGNEIVNEVGVPVITTVVDEVVTNIKAFFQAIPAQELALD